MRCSMLGQMIWIWGWESSLSADLHCESWITRLWGWGSSELLGVWYGRDTGELQERKMQCMQVEVSNSVSAGAAQGNLARNKQSKCRSHNPSSIIKDNSLEGEEKR